jgi:hypothetical protein
MTVLGLHSFRAHNGFLEVALKWGLLGLALYLSLLLLALRGLPDLNPGATGLLALHVFFYGSPYRRGKGPCGPYGGRPWGWGQGPSSCRSRLRAGDPGKWRSPVSRASRVSSLLPKARAASAQAW